jgi:hypothetical protein
MSLNRGRAGRFEKRQKLFAASLAQAFQGMSLVPSIRPDAFPHQIDQRSTRVEVFGDILSQSPDIRSA